MLDIDKIRNLAEDPEEGCECQEVLAGELSGARRVRCHAQIGEAVEQLYAANLRAHATELAHHFARAQPVLGSEKIVRYFRLAGEEALAASSGHFLQNQYQRLAFLRPPSILHSHQHP